MNLPFFLNVQANPTVQDCLILNEAVNWNNNGRECSRRGDHAAAVACHRRALEMKLAQWGDTKATTAISYNALGEALTQLGRLDEAEYNLKKAIPIAMRLNPVLDQAGYRENLAVVYEMKGDLEKAKEIRLSGKPHMLCAWNEV